MKNFPDIVSFTKSHKKKTFKGVKGSTFFTFTTGIRVKKNIYMTSIQYETMRRIIVKSLRAKNKKSKIVKKKLKIKNYMSLSEISYDYNPKIKSHRKNFSKKKKLSFRLRHHFYSPITKKPLQVRMGKGKGDPYNWISPTASSKMIFEISRKNQKIKNIYKHSQKISQILPGRTKFIHDRKNLRRENNFLKILPQIQPKS